MQRKSREKKRAEEMSGNPAAAAEVCLGLNMYYNPKEDGRYQLGEHVSEQESGGKGCWEDSGIVMAARSYVWVTKSKERGEEVLRNLREGGYASCLCFSYPTSYLENIRNCESENILFIFPSRYMVLSYFWGPSYKICHKTCIK